MEEASDANSLASDNFHLSVNRIGFRTHIWTHTLSQCYSQYMVTKIYKYQLAPNSWEEFLKLQKKADALYSKHISYEVSFIRDLKNPWKITELHCYTNLETAKKAESLHEIEPELKTLFKKFTKMLDAKNPKIRETIGELVFIR